jgi:hypothetical protein
MRGLARRTASEHGCGIFGLISVHLNRRIIGERVCFEGEINFYYIGNCIGPRFYSKSNVVY